MFMANSRARKGDGYLLISEQEVLSAFYNYSTFVFIVYATITFTNIQFRTMLLKVVCV